MKNVANFTTWPTSFSNATTKKNRETFLFEESLETIDKQMGELILIVGFLVFWTSGLSGRFGQKIWLEFSSS